MESELSEKILTLLLDEQVKLLSSEIDERQKQLEMIAVIKENILNKAVTPVNSILDIEDIMEKKNKTRNTRKLALIYVGVGIAATLGLLFMVWLVMSQIWWGLAVYLSFALLGISVSVLQLKDNVFICPNCDAVFKPSSLWRAFFTTGDTKVRWTTCPECKNKGWCVLHKENLQK
jgi:tetrahydromethanopterin S-methyltransferase subunit B